MKQKLLLEMLSSTILELRANGQWALHMYTGAHGILSLHLMMIRIYRSAN